jgi:hypothetical protein
VGTDRKGPLAAFVVIAIVAAILLVTSVRSQAEPNWFVPREPPATVVAAPPISDPLRWAPVAPMGPLGQVVKPGVVLVRRATAEASMPAVTTSASPAAPNTAAVNHHPDVVHTVAQTAPQTASQTAPQKVSHPVQHAAPSVVRHVAQVAPSSTPLRAPQTAATSATPQHGRHLGWSHASGARAQHGHGRHRGWRHRS